MSEHHFDDCEEFESSLEKMQENAENLGGGSDVSLSDLLSNSFLAEHSRFASLEEFTEASGLDFGSSQSFDAIDPVVLDSFVQENSSFANWQEMINEAVLCYLGEKLFDGV